MDHGIRHGTLVRRCGVGFVTARSLNPAIMEFAAKNDVAVLPGALTPTEVVTIHGCAMLRPTCSETAFTAEIIHVVGEASDR